MMEVGRENRPKSVVLNPELLDESRPAAGQ
jgi:hypothetical protein